MTEAQVRFQRLDYSILTADEVRAGERPCRFGLECPRGRGRCDGLLIVGADLGNGQAAKRGPAAKPAMWDWNGSVEAPTFSPSIHCRDFTDDGKRAAGCGWHGYIREGKIA